MWTSLCILLSRIAILVCPGGSYSWLDRQNEGYAVASWLEGQGIYAKVVKYRVATVPAYIFGFRVLGLGHKYPDMLEDIERELTFLYEHADSLDIDTAKIGVMGFSAGGHLTLMSYANNRTAYKPKFLCPIYPVVTMNEKCSHHRSRRGALGVWRQFNQAMRDSLSMEDRITDDFPPVLMVAAEDDPVVKFENALLLDSALTAHHIAHTFVRYQTGGHGFGITKDWINTFKEWISNLNL